MRKYLTLFGLSWQKQLEVRSEFLFERTRSITLLVSLYFLWTALLSNRTDLFSYSREQILTYVFLMTLLRAWVLGCVTDRIPMEISKGKLSDVLLRPVSQIGYWAAQDAASKSLHVTFAILELSVFFLLFRPPLLGPADAVSAAGFALTTLGGMVLYFQMSYMLGVMGFWTAQSWGPRFCFEVILEFCAGAYFPIDLLPAKAQVALHWLPFPYLVFYPASIYLGRVSPPEILLCLIHQVMWIAVFSLAVRVLWTAGLRHYAAEGR